MQILEGFIPVRDPFISPLCICFASLNKYRNSRPDVFCKKGVLKTLQISQKSTCAGVLKKDSLAQVFSCEFSKIFKNTFFTEHVWTTASIFISISFMKKATATLLKKRHVIEKEKCFSVNFAKFLRAAFFTEHLRWLFL